MSKSRSVSTRGTNLTTKGLNRSKLWLEMGVQILKEEGIEQVRVDRIADRLGITKGSFYHLYKDRQDLLNAMIEHWRTENQSYYFSFAEKLQGEPGARLLHFLESVIRAKADEYDASFRAWGNHDPLVGAAVQSVDQERIAFLSNFFKEMGFGEDEIETRASLLYYADIGMAFSGDPRRLVSLRLQHVRKIHAVLMVKEKGGASTEDAQES